MFMAENALYIKKMKQKNIKKIGIAGNPNVGKSTIFNHLTGLNQHTGNWPGKTVESAKGKFFYNSEKFELIDTPGTYSLFASSVEEEVARDFICFNSFDAIIIVLDATRLERSLRLALQILEVTQNAVVCVNLIDEAIKKGIEINLDELSLQLGTIVVGTDGRKGTGLSKLVEETKKICDKKQKTFKINTDYGNILEESIKKIEDEIKLKAKNIFDSRWVSIKMLESDKKFCEKISKYLELDFETKFFVENEIKKIIKNTKNENFIQDTISSSIVERAEKIFKVCVNLKNKNYDRFDRTMDKFLTSKITGFPVMIFALLIIFWLTIVGANYPSELLSFYLFQGENFLSNIFSILHIPNQLSNLLIFGVYRTLVWVVSVMLPPMAIFFPLFTFLEDIGYLPRVAFNLDRLFKNSGAHGKQALTMCMGFGCNACGVSGCRIIDSPRERLIATITNNFIPCNGRIPTLLSVTAMFFSILIPEKFRSIVSAIIITFIILLAVTVTFLVSLFLSKTFLKGISSSFILELPPYRKPKISQILVRSVFDRTIFVLARAVMLAIPAGFIIWIFANIKISGLSILSYSANFLDPFAKIIGLDGVILLAFILGFPANEIVIPIIIMSYLSTESILELGNLSQLHSLLISNSWTYTTAICTMLFSVFHFPCGTTLWTIKKETGSTKWTFFSAILPTIIGVTLCFATCQIFKLLNFIMPV